MGDTVQSKTLKVAELFAGVGGFRLGLEGWQGKSSSSKYQFDLRGFSEKRFEVVWSNQWEPSTKRQHANEVYRSRWPEADHNGSDISSVPTSKIPDHDVLVGGFPCQDYSVATTLKNSGGLYGKKGVLWWQIERIIREKGDAKPKYLMFENVDRLLKSPASQRGRDFAMILASLSDLGYAVEWRVINAADYGMPQKRRRIFIVGFHASTPEYQAIKHSSSPSDVFEDGIFGQSFPIGPVSNQQISEGILEGDLAELSQTFNHGARQNSLSPFANSGFMLDRSFWTAKSTPDFIGKAQTLGDVLEPMKMVPNEYIVDGSDLDKWKYLKGPKRIDKVNKTLGYSYVFSEGGMAFPDPTDGPSRTIITGEGGKSPSRTKHIILQNRKYRRLLPVELERLNMFPDNHTELAGIPDGKRAFFMGNALVVGVVERLGNALLESVQSNKTPTTELTESVSA